MTVHQKENLFVLTALYGGHLGGPQGPFFAQNSTVFTLHPHNPPYWAQTDPTRWDHIFSIAWGNFGYLRFSGRWPFGRLAGRFFGPNSPKWPLTRPNMQKWPKIFWGGTFIKNHSGFGESNVQSAIASFCLVFRAFWQINSTTSWPTVGGWGIISDKKNHCRFVLL